MPPGNKLLVLSVLLFVVAVRSYDINTCWQQCFNSPPAVRALSRDEIVRGTLGDRSGGRSSSSSSSSSGSSERDADSYISGSTTFSLLNQLGLEARRLRERYDSKAVNFLLDASLSHKHNQSSETAAIWRQQKDLAFILAVMLELGDDGVGSGSIILFDQSFAWSCPQLQCLDACQVGSALNNLNQFQTTWESGRRGDIQAACTLGNHNLRQNSGNISCPVANNPMAVTVANSDLEKNFHRTRSSKRRYDDQQDLSCGSYQARYLVGTHSSTESDQKYWASKTARSRYVPDDWQTMAAVAALADCMWASCCPGTPPVPLPTNCLKADGYQGENIEQYSPA